LFKYSCLIRYLLSIFGRISGADAFKKEARKKGICIAIEERIQNKRESFAESIDNLIKKLQPDKKVGARVVVLFVGTEYVPELLKHTAERMKLSAGYSKKKIIWLASESWDRNNDKYMTGHNRLAAQGALVLMLASQKVPSFDEASCSRSLLAVQSVRDKKLTIQKKTTVG
ncbi:hypothetical protein OESDEN_00190, partial [Oesophagostomum dentatum]